jgi:ABC-2 type transport system permease protein
LEDKAVRRYLRLLLALARFSLAGEMAMRGNFLIKVVVELMWLGILLVFYRSVVFDQTSSVATWSEGQYLFFVGCYFCLQSLMETIFLANFDNFADLVRTGELDFILLKPIDEQFLVSCKGIDWSTAPSVLLGVAVMVAALIMIGEPVPPGRVVLFGMMFVCGLALAYSFLLLLASTSVWLLRNQSLYEVWWLVTSLMRYPREIFRGPWAEPVGWFFMFVIPVMLVANVPAGVMVRSLDDPALLGFTLVVTAALVILSRRFFRFALRRYRSASS